MPSLLDAMLGAASAVLHVLPAGDAGALAPYVEPTGGDPPRAPTPGALPLAAAIEPVEAAVLVEATLAPARRLALTPRVRVVPAAWPFMDTGATAGVELEVAAALAVTPWLAVDAVVTRAAATTAAPAALALATGVTVTGARGFLAVRARADAARASTAIELAAGGTVRGVDVELALAGAAKLAVTYAW